MQKKRCVIEEHFRGSFVWSTTLFAELDEHHFPIREEVDGRARHVCPVHCPEQTSIMLHKFTGTWWYLVVFGGIWWHLVVFDCIWWSLVHCSEQTSFMPYKFGGKGCLDQTAFVNTYSVCLHPQRLFFEK